MKSELIKILRCPNSKQSLKLTQAHFIDNEIESAWLVSQDGKFRYPVNNFVPCFVSKDNYADNFGFQWNYFNKTQLDSHTGQLISSNRFWRSTGWDELELKDKWVLDVGCGSGRFSEIALNAGAKVVALDYSNAVDACLKNFRNHPNLYVVQADMYSLPFEKEFFSYVFSLGVLQHTPKPEEAFYSITSVLQKDGKICVDFYEKSWKSFFLPKYWLRPITKRLPNEVLFKILKKIVPLILPISRLVSKLPLIGATINKVLPIANYYGILQLNKQQHLEWSLLDTYDWLSPEFDYPQKSKNVRLWLELAKLSDIEVFKDGHLIARGRK